MQSTILKELVPATSFFIRETDKFWKEAEIDNILVDIACQFINYRLDNNLTQKDLASLLHISQSMVSKLESGEYNPTVRLLAEIAQKLSWKFILQLDVQAVNGDSYNYHSDIKDQGDDFKKYKELGLAS